MWQKCPICNGSGIAQLENGYTQYNDYTVTPKCNVCNGMKIISEVNGLPPNWRPSEESKHSVEELKKYQKWLNESHELSDEEIKKVAERFEQHEFYGAGRVFIKGAIWYREQLKQRQ